MIECKRCEIAMVPDREWRRMTPEQRAATGRRRHVARRLCSTCYTAAVIDETLVDYEPTRSITSSEMVLEEAEFLLDLGVTSLEAMSTRIGISRDALTLTLRRRARAGDERAKAIRAQLPALRKAA